MRVSSSKSKHAKRISSEEPQGKEKWNSVNKGLTKKRESLSGGRKSRGSLNLLYLHASRAPATLHGPKVSRVKERALLRKRLEKSVVNSGRNHMKEKTGEGKSDPVYRSRTGRYSQKPSFKEDLTS